MPTSRHLRQIVLAMLLSLAACTEVRHKLVEIFDAPYKAEHEGASGPRTGEFELRTLLSGLQEPTDLQFDPDQPAHLYITSKAGQLSWTDLSDGSRRTVGHFDVLTTSEQGLLGLALHPNFARNRRAYVNYVRAGNDGDESVVQAITIGRDAAGRPDGLQQGAVIYRVSQPYPNHNAGQIAFGPDGHLYVGWGDGGWRNDPHDYGQNGSVALGSMLRLDVDSATDRFVVPADNPFLSNKHILPETWAIGFRNPWRFSFTPDGRLIVADVGQDRVEEIHIVEAGGNYGWKIREGTLCFEPQENCPTAGLVDPIWTYPRDQGLSITGGYTYPVSAASPLAGHYIFGDFVSGRIWALDLHPQAPHAEAIELGKWAMLFSTFGFNGEQMVVADFGQGTVYELVHRPVTTPSP